MRARGTSHRRRVRKRRRGSTETRCTWRLLWGRNGERAPRAVCNGRNGRSGFKRSRVCAHDALATRGNADKRSVRPAAVESVSKRSLRSSPERPDDYSKQIQNKGCPKLSPKRPGDLQKQFKQKAE